jgi:hypothetical protein
MRLSDTSLALVGGIDPVSRLKWFRLAAAETNARASYQRELGQLRSPTGQPRADQMARGDLRSMIAAKRLKINRAPKIAAPAEGRPHFRLPLRGRIFSVGFRSRGRTSVISTFHSEGRTPTYSHLRSLACSSNSIPSPEIHRNLDLHRAENRLLRVYLPAQDRRHAGIRCQLTFFWKIAHPLSHPNAWCCHEGLNLTALSRHACRDVSYCS